MIDAIANALGPWYVILGFLSVVIGLAVYLRKWLKSIAADAKESAAQSTSAALAANTAKDEAKTAGASAASAKQNSADANEAIAFMADRLGQVLAEKDYMARRNDRMLAVNLEYRNLLTQNNISIPARLEPTGTETGETEAQTITGRHRLRTSMVPTIYQEPNDDDQPA